MVRFYLAFPWRLIKQPVDTGSGRYISTGIDDGDFHWNIDFLRLARPH